jgi:molybdate transport system substrate-binding protein
VKGAAGQAVRLHAAGSLRAPLSEIAEDFTAATGIAVVTRFGPTGLLRREIEDGAAADVFASADMAHPRALAKRLGGTVRAFAANRLCALARPRLGLSSETLLERLLDPALRVGMSTPGADPSGDYAMQLFAKAEALRPGAAAVLARKALRLTGDAVPNTRASRERNVYAAILETGDADLFLTWRTNALAARHEVPTLDIVDTPLELTVDGEYGLIVLGLHETASELADRMLSTAGQEVLRRYDFMPAAVAHDLTEATLPKHSRA